MIRRLVVGDIHGCWDPLMRLLDRAGLSAGDEVVALGDIVDRGPDSPRVLDFFTSSPMARSLMGNHERKHVRSFRGEIRPALSQLITREQLGEERYPHTCGLLEGFPSFLELPEALLVHGFFEPGVPLAEQRETVIVGTLSGERYLERRYDRPWYELYHGERPLIVGHLDYLADGKPLVHRDLVYGIDTGCCHGRALTGLLLPEFRLLSVSGGRNYWEETRSRYAQLQSLPCSNALAP